MSSVHRVPTDCPSCHRRGTVTRPSGWWTVALVGAYVVFSAMVFGASLLGPTIIAVLPMLAAAGLGLLPFLHERAGAPATCRACDKIVPASEPARTASPSLVARAVRTA